MRELAQVDVLLAPFAWALLPIAALFLPDGASVVEVRSSNEFEPLFVYSLLFPSVRVLFYSPLSHHFPLYPLYSSYSALESPSFCPIFSFFSYLGVPGSLNSLSASFLWPSRGWTRPPALLDGEV